MRGSREVDSLSDILPRGVVGRKGMVSVSCDTSSGGLKVGDLARLPNIEDGLNQSVKSS